LINLLTPYAEHAARLHQLLAVLLAAATAYGCELHAAGPRVNRAHLLLCGVHLDVHIVAQLVCTQVGGEGDEALLPESALEQIAGAMAETLTTRHLV
jgi:hypothetical protein